MDEDLLSYVVDYAQQKGATYADARYEHQFSEEVVVKNGIVDALFSGEDRGVGLRVLAGGGLGFVGTNQLTKPALRDAVSAAVKTAKASARKTPIKFAREKAIVTEWKVPEETKLLDVAPEEKVKELLDIDRAATSAGAKLVARMFFLSDKVLNKLFVNSEGSRIRSYSPRVRLLFFLTAVRDGDSEQAYRNYGWSGGWEALREWDAENKAREEARSLQLFLEKGKKGPEGKVDLVIGPQVAGIASHESCGHPTEADRILGREASQAGKSFITPAKVGDKVGSPVVNVCDDPTVKHAIAYYETDDEGVRARRRYLYKAGRIHEFLQNRETAAKLRTRSNGAARATNWDREAIVRMANTFVEPGDHRPEELFEGVRRGIYMRTFLEWNIDDVRFNQKYVSREAYRIENGEVTEPLRKVTLEVTTPAFWSAVDAVGNDLEFEAGFCGKSDPEQPLDAAMGGPHMRMRGIRVR